MEHNPSGNRRARLVLATFICLCRLVAAGSAEGVEAVNVVRVPQRGIQPQTATDDTGALHLIYFAGKPAAGDLFYVNSHDGGVMFSEPIRVNSQPGSAVAIGNIRGAHLAIGEKGRVHVAWMGAQNAEPKAPGGEQPMLYTRLTSDRSGFEPQRNVITKRTGLDGGGSIAADGSGNVYVVWHAFGEGEQEEANRRVWIAASRDGGTSFAAETAANTEFTGACACCGMKAFADSRGKLYIVYRTAKDMVNRDTHLLLSSDHGRTFTENKLQPWNIGHCMMSSSALAEGPAGILAGWETEEQVHFSALSTSGKPSAAPVRAPGKGQRRKHPALAVNSQGEILLAWTEQMGWNKGGALAWQIFDEKGAPVRGKSGKIDGVPTWSLVAAFARPDGQFVVIY